MRCKWKYVTNVNIELWSGGGAVEGAGRGRGIGSTRPWRLGPWVGQVCRGHLEQGDYTLFLAEVSGALRRSCAAYSEPCCPSGRSIRDKATTPGGGERQRKGLKGLEGDHTCNATFSLATRGVFAVSTNRSGLCRERVNDEITHAEESLQDSICSTYSNYVF